MFTRFKSLLRKAARRLATLPLRMVSPAVRVAAMEELSDGMLYDVPMSKGTLRFQASTTLLRMRAQNALTKEPDTIRWLDEMPEDGVLWDVGANVGVYSLYAARFRHARVLAFEPSAANYQVLCRNIQLNHVSDQATAYCLAFAGHSQLGLLWLPSAAMGQSLTQFSERGEKSRYHENGMQGLTQATIGFAIDEFVTRFSPALPTHLKVDVDGLELEILKGAYDFIRHPELNSIMIELTLTKAGETQEALSLIEAAGFKLRARGEIQGFNTEQAANHWFVRS